MPMTAATFDCPHCSAKYPVKPVLVGKTVRCTSCKQAFRLRDDGIADKVEMAVSTQSVAAGALPPAAPAAAEPAPASSIVAAVSAAAKTEPRLESKPAPRLESKPVSPPTSRLSPPTPKAGMTEQQLEARKAMSENLKAAMGDVFASDTPDVEAATPSKPGTARVTAAERSAKSSSFLKSAGKKPGKSPAILTNEGEREAANQRRWLEAFIGLITVVGLIVWLASHQNERATAVTAFTKELPASELRYGARIEAIRARAWVNDITTFIDLPSPRISAEREIPSASLEPLTKLKGLTYVASAQRWVAPDTAAWIAKQPALTNDQLNTKLERDGAIQNSLAALRKELSAANLGDDEMTIVITLLTQIPAGSTGRPAPKFTELIAQGQLPTIRWCSVTGRGGTHVVDRGQGYSFPTADYRGFLVSFSGEGWPAGWRLMTLAADK